MKENNKMVLCADSTEPKLVSRRWLTCHRKGCDLPLYLQRVYSGVYMGHKGVHGIPPWGSMGAAHKISKTGASFFFETADTR